MGRGTYRFEAASVEGFVQQLAAGYMPHGYWFYVRGRIPERKPVEAVDRKLLRRYEVAMSPWQRVRRRRRALERREPAPASVQYLRLDRTFVLLATHGHHQLFEDEARALKDFRRAPLRFGGYSIALRGGRASVRIEDEQFKVVRAAFTDQALRLPVEQLGRAFRELPFVPYAPVRRQLFRLLRAVNERRKIAGLEEVPPIWLQLKRKPVPVFRDEGISRRKSVCF